MTNQSSTEANGLERPRTPFWVMFQNRDYLHLLGAGALNNIGIWTEVLVLGWLVLKLTDSVWQVALMAALRWMPLLFLGILSGLIADRADRRRVMMIASSGSVLTTATLLTLIITDSIQAWHIHLGALTLGLFFVLNFPSRYSFLYDIVGAQNLVRAISLEVITMTTGKTVGPLMAALLFALTGFTGAYSFILAVYVLALILIARITSRTGRSPTSRQPAARSLVAGLAYALSNKALLGVLAITLIINFMGFSALGLLTVVARDHLDVGVSLMLVLASAEGMGLFIGATTVAFLGAIRYAGRVFVVGSASLLLSLLLFALSPWYPLSFIALLAMGLSSSGFFTMQSTIVLTSADPNRRGMAMGVLSLAIGIMPLGILMMGATATILSPQAAIGMSAAVGLLLMVPVAMLTPLVRRPAAVGEAVGPRATPATDRRP